MPYLSEKYSQAKKLRSTGYSLKEISKKLEISKSTASLWLSDFKLSPSALIRLENRKLIGRVRSSETKKRKREERESLIREEVVSFVDSIKITESHFKMFCALIYWCEGTKNVNSGLTFVNSDPELIKSFLFFLRSSFDIDEKRLRVGLHLHGYHSHKKQIAFWSKVTEIPTSQFIRPYDKPNTGKRKKDNYPGCASIRYYDSQLAKKISFLAQELLKKYGGVG